MREAAIHDAAADLRPHRRLVDLRIPAPLLLARARIDGEHDAPVRDAVDGAVRDERRRFLTAAAGSHVVGPGEAQPLHVRRVDLLERAVARFAWLSP